MNRKTIKACLIGWAVPPLVASAQLEKTLALVVS